VCGRGSHGSLMLNALWGFYVYPNRQAALYKVIAGDYRPMLWGANK